MTRPTEPRLFDPAATEAQPCPVPGCPAIRLPGQTVRIVTCQHDLDRASGNPGRRHRACLNACNPETAEIPY